MSTRASAASDSIRPFLTLTSMDLLLYVGPVRHTNYWSSEPHARARTGIARSALCSLENQGARVRPSPVRLYDIFILRVFRVPRCIYGSGAAAGLSARLPRSTPRAAGAPSRQRPGKTKRDVAPPWRDFQ